MFSFILTSLWQGVIFSAPALLRTWSEVSFSLFVRIKKQYISAAVQCAASAHCWQTRFTSQWTTWQFLNHIFITFRRAQKVENCTDWHNANLTVEREQRCGVKMQILCHNNFSHFPNLNLYLTCILLSVHWCSPCGSGMVPYWPIHIKLQVRYKTFEVDKSLLSLLSCRWTKQQYAP